MPLFSSIFSAAPAEAPRSFKIDIPVDQDLLPETRTPDDAAAEKRSHLSTPRVPKSPAELRKSEEQSAKLRAAYVEAVQAKATREIQRAAEAKERRLRAEAITRQKLQTRFDSADQRDVREEKKQASHSKAATQQARAAEAAAARAAMSMARDAKLADASDRVEESSRRAARLVRHTALKNARQVKRVPCLNFLPFCGFSRLARSSAPSPCDVGCPRLAFRRKSPLPPLNARQVKRALAVVAGRNQAAAADAQAALGRLSSRLEGAAARRTEAMEAAAPPPVSARLESARGELARMEVERAMKKQMLKRSLEAASERRDAEIGDKVSSSSLLPFSPPCTPCCHASLQVHPLSPPHQVRSHKVCDPSDLPAHPSPASSPLLPFPHAGLLPRPSTPAPHPRPSTYFPHSPSLSHRAQVSRARADLDRVASAHDSRAASAAAIENTRRALFAKLNAAQVNAANANAARARKAAKEVSGSVVSPTYSLAPVFTIALLDCARPRRALFACCASWRSKRHRARARKAAKEASQFRRLAALPFLILP
jgi:hypothetical protein